MKVKIEHEGQPCRKCDTPVKLVNKRKKLKLKKQLKQGAYYTYHYLCPRCKTIYYVESSKRTIDKQQELF